MTLPCRPRLTKCRPNCLFQAIEAKVKRRNRGVEAQCLCKRPPSALSQAIVREVERRKRAAEAQCLCQRPPSALSQAIPAKVERRNRGVEAQCLCQRPPSALSHAAAFEAQHIQIAPRFQAVQLLQKPSVMIKWVLFVTLCLSSAVNRWHRQRILSIV